MVRDTILTATIEDVPDSVRVTLPSALVKKVIKKAWAVKSMAEKANLLSLAYPDSNFKRGHLI